MAKETQSGNPRATTSRESRSTSGPQQASRIRGLAWLPLPLFLAVLATLAVLDIHARFEPPYLLPILNIVFLTMVSWTVAYLAAKSYIAGKAHAVLFLGCGMWVLGLASAIAAVFGYLRMDGFMVAVHNSGTFLSALFILLSAWLSTGRAATSPSKGSVWWLPISYLASLGAMVLVTAGIWNGFIPPFFIPGQGATLLRQVIVVAAAAQYTASSLLFAAIYRRSQAQFLRWYSLGLGLIAIGLLGVLPEIQLGTPINWVARLSQYLGGVYILYAVFTVFRQFHAWGIPVVHALKEIERRHRSLVDLCPDAILVHSEGKYVYANPAAARLFNASSPADVTGRDVLELVAPPFRDLARQRILQAYAGEVTSLREMQYLRLNGEVIDVETTGAMVEFGGRAAIQIVARDITERKQAQAELRRSERLYRAIGESIDYGIWVCDTDGRNIYASESFLKMVGLTQEQCSNFGWGDVLHPDDAQRTIAAWKKCVQEGGAWDIEHRFRGVDGLWHDVLARGVPVRDEQGQITCWAGINLDISRLKRAEEALRKTRDELDQRVQQRTEQLSRTVDTLNAEVAHRTRVEQALREGSEQLRLLASELTLAEQRERQRLAQVLHDGLQQILVGAKFRLALLGRVESENARKAAAEVGDLIDDAIETSRSLTAELSPPILREGGLVPALEWLARWMQDHHGLTLDLQAHGSTEPVDEEVSVLFFQATRELLFNVVKHSGVKTARVEVSREAGLIHISVTDEGTGFDPAQLRASGGNTGGFGLFSVRERLNLLGGRMEIASAAGTGSRITLIAPASARKGDTRTASPGRESQVSVSLSPLREVSEIGTESKIRILLADDHIVMRQGLRRLLQEEPDMVIVGEASEGESAVNLVREVRPHVVLMDISMPGMNGIKATQIIRHEMPGVQVIGLSMFEEENLATAMREAGAATYVTKSGPSHAVIAAIRACVRRSDSSQKPATDGQEGHAATADRPD